MIEIGYIAICVLLIPFFKWQQVMEARSFPMIFVTLASASMMLIGGIRIPMDAITYSASIFAIWVVASGIWSERKQSVLETMNWVSYIFLFLSARIVPLDIVMWMLFAPGVVFSILTLAKRFKGEEHKIHGSPIFGNNNHNSAFHLIHLFVGIYLAYQGHWYVIPFVILIAWCIGVLRCKGAWISATVSLLIINFFITDGYIWPSIAVGFALLAGYGIYQEFKTKWGSSVQRYLLCLAACEMIKQRPFFGWGLNMYRVMLPEMNILLSHKQKVQELADKVGGFHSNASHRVHNDHFEILAELGIIGYMLFLGIFSQINLLAYPILLGGIIAYLIDACFFFPLREAHTGIPFWVLLGAVAGVASPPTPVTINPFFMAILLFVIAGIGLNIFKKLMGVVYWDLGGREKDPEKQRHYLYQAINADPYNGMYLAQGFFCNVGPQPDFALTCAILGLAYYDGTKVKWGIMDQFARAVLRMNHINIAQSYVEKSLRLNPHFEQAKDLKKELDRVASKQEMPKVVTRKDNPKEFERLEKCRQ